MKSRVLVASLVAVMASLVLAASASASGKAAVVTTISDSPVLSPPNCSLRDAIIAVTNDAATGGCAITSPGGDDKITFDPSLSGQTISLSLGALDINDPDDLLITGPGMNQLTVTAHDASRVLNVATGTHIIGMSLVHGNAPATGGSAQGGAINSTASGIFSLFLTDVKVADSAAEATAAASTTFADGGAIHSANGRLVLEQSVVTGNHATATGTDMATAEARGGAIFAEGGASITDSTISDNQATATTVGSAKDAQATSGIRSDDELDMSGSTVSGNIAAADAPGTGSNSIARGALFLNNGAGVNDLEQSTIAANKGDATGATPVQTGGLDIGNDTAISASTIALNGPDTATSDGANIRVEGGANQIFNSIVADPRGGGKNCVGQFSSDGFNDDYSPAGTSCLVTPLTTDGLSNPLLAPVGLANNGGLTQTIALQPTSPVIDQGSNTGLTDAGQDQRGPSFIRPVDFTGLGPDATNGTDIGAFEVQQACAGFTQPTPTTACPSAPIPPPPATTSTPPPTKKKKCKKAKKGASSAKKKCKKKK